MFDHTDKVLKQLRKDIDQTFPDWLEDLFKRNIDPDGTEAIGYSMAKARESFQKLETIKDMVKDARQKIVKNMQANCAHDYVVVKFGNKNSQYRSDREDRYVCEACGSMESGKNTKFKNSRVRVIEKDVWEFYRMHNDIKRLEKQ